MMWQWKALALNVSLLLFKMTHVFISCHSLATWLQGSTLSSYCCYHNLLQQAICGGKKWGGGNIRWWMISCVLESCNVYSITSFKQTLIVKTLVCCKSSMSNINTVGTDIYVNTKLVCYNRRGLQVTDVVKERIYSSVSLLKKLSLDYGVRQTVWTLSLSSSS